MTMLILSRRPGEEIVIDGNIRLKIIAVKGSQVRIGIRAPPQIRVDRKEVHDGRTEQDSAPPSNSKE
jgi:carbon storage regulator